MASPRRDPQPPDRPPDRPLDRPLDRPPAAARPDQGERVAITIKPERTNTVDAPADGPDAARDARQGEAPALPDAPDDQCYVRNSSFLSRDIEAQKAKVEVGANAKSPPLKEIAPPKRDVSLSKKDPPINTGTASPPKNETPSPKLTSPPVKREAVSSPPKREVTSPPVKEAQPPPKKEVTAIPKVTSPPPVSDVVSPPPKRDNSSTPFKKEITSPPPSKVVTSPPVSAFKLNRGDSKTEENIFLAKNKKEPVLVKEIPIKNEKLSLVSDGNDINNFKTCNNENGSLPKNDAEENNSDNTRNEESHGVGDKIKKFEKAAEDASASSGRLSRPGSVRGRSRTERLGSDSKDDLPPPATPFKDNIHFELGNVSEKSASIESHVNFTGPLERQQSLTRNSANSASLRWQRSDSNSVEEKIIQKPEPLKIIKPEFKTMASPSEVTIRSPSLGTKIADQFPSQGTAFRNVAASDAARANPHKANDDVNTQNNFKTCKFKNKEKYSVSKGSSYFTRGSEEIWLVKKKDIEEIEERVLDSFRRAGGSLCMRESVRPASDSGQGASFTHATMGRNKRHTYGRSESLDPQWAGGRSQTLKRQSSVACTCGHDKKARAKSAGAEPPARPRSRSHGDDNNQAHVLDKYETLV